MNETGEQAKARRYSARQIVALVVMAIVAVALAFGAYTGFSGTFEVRYTQPEAQALVNKYMPFHVKQEMIKQKLHTNLVHDVEVSGLEVKFGNGQADLTVHASAVLLKKTYEMDGRAVGTPRFDHSRENRGEVFFIPSKVELLGPPRANGADVGQTAGKLIERFGTQGMRDHKDEISAELKTWAEAQIQHAFENVLTKVPAYKLPDNNKGRIASAAVQSAAIQGDTLVVTLSYTKALGEVGHIVLVYIALGFFVIGMLGLLLLCPDLLLFAALLP